MKYTVDVKNQIIKVVLKHFLKCFRNKMYERIKNKNFMITTLK